MSASRSSSPSITSTPPPRVIGKRPRMSRFMRVLVAITATVHAPFVVGAAEALQRYQHVRAATAWGVALGLGVLGVLLFLGRAKNAMNDAHRPFWRTFLVDVPYYVHWAACVWCLVPSLVYLLLEPAIDLARGAPVAPSPGFFMWTYAAGLVVCGYGVTIRRWWFVVKRVDVTVRDLPPELDGYTIAHLSDLHIGALTPLWWAKRWARAANAAKPDMVVITGDMVTSGVAFHEDIAELVSELHAPAGVFVSMGNHDYFGEGEPLISLLREKGRATVLRNEGQVIERNGGKMYLAAIDDTWTRRADMDRALEGRPDGMRSILLAHDPDKFPHAREHKVDVVLSGHTHGGQIAVPFFARYVNASKLAHRYHVGVYTDGDSTLYVHPGLGTTGPPIRLGVAPAVALVTLRRRG
jgi:predicted MPP superfamily phosphohydrolase